MFRDFCEVSTSAETRFNEVDFTRLRWTAGAHAPAVEDLARTVIARLAGRKPAAPPPTRDVIESFCTALIAPDEDACADYVAQLRLSGVGHADLTTVVFPDAARMLGAWWQDDRISFFECTLGTCRLISLLRALQPETPATLARTGRHALFATLPDEAHTIGITIAADLFRRDGWDIDLRTGPATRDLVAAVRDNATPIVCLCASTERALPDLRDCIAALARLPERPHCFVAGIIADLRPDVADLVGADAALTDIPLAIPHLAEVVAGRTLTARRRA
jgi:methanogenic corrinoid protein MtbC1